MRRQSDDTFSESDQVSRSLAADRQRRARTKLTSGQDSTIDAGLIDDLTSTESRRLSHDLLEQRVALLHQGAEE